MDRGQPSWDFELTGGGGSQFGLGLLGRSRSPLGWDPPGLPTACDERRSHPDYPGLAAQSIRVRIPRSMLTRRAGLRRNHCGRWRPDKKSRKSRRRERNRCRRHSRGRRLGGVQACWLAILLGRARVLARTLRNPQPLLRRRLLHRRTSHSRTRPRGLRPQNRRNRRHRNRRRPRPLPEGSSCPEY